MNNVKLQWKKLSNITPYQILFEKENQKLLQNILSYKITEFEIDNLPSYYIISFIQVLQNYLFYYLKDNNPNINLLNQNINNNNYIDEIISYKNNQIEKLNKKIIEYQEIINQKDKLLNDTNKKLFLLYNQYTKLQEEYKFKINKYKNEMKEKEENIKEMDDKLIETFKYLTTLFKFSNEDISIDKRQNSQIINKLKTTRTFNHEANRIKGDGLEKQFSTNFSSNKLNRVFSARNYDINKIKK